ncbi:hypothetical protein NEOC95_001768 [Neochlamydia sp. AcF95]|nr:hypothetical protein [Neochlamydia sp. AcF95]
MLLPRKRLFSYFFLEKMDNNEIILIFHGVKAFLMYFIAIGQKA